MSTLRMMAPSCGISGRAQLGTGDLQWIFSAASRRPGLLSDWEERERQRCCTRLANDLVLAIRGFSSAVVVGGREIAAPVSRLVEIEAVRLAALFAETGMDVASDIDEVAMPSVHQSASGAVQFEWHRRGTDLEIVVLPNGRISGYVETEAGGRDLDLSAGLWDIKRELETVLVR